MDINRLWGIIAFPLNLLLVAGTCHFAGMDPYDVRHASWWIVILAVGLSVLESMGVDRALVRWGRMDAEGLRWRDRVSYLTLGVLVVVTAGIFVYHRSEEAREREEEAQRQQRDAEEARTRQQLADVAPALEALRAQKLRPPATKPATAPSATAPSAAPSSGPGTGRE